MKEIGSDAFWNLVDESGGRLLLICAPNYEIRSTAFCETLGEGAASRNRDVRVLWWQFHNDSARANELADLMRMNEENFELKLQALKWNDLSRNRIPYTRSNDHFNPISHTLRSELQRAHYPVVALDITAIPRRVLIDTLGRLADHIGSNDLDKLVLFYTEPFTYPVAAHPFRYKAFSSHGNEGVALNELFPEDHRVSLAIVLGSDPNVVEQVLAAFPSKHKAQLFAYIGQRDLWNSYSALRAHTDIHTRETVTLQHFIEFELGYIDLINWAKTIHLDQRTSFVLASFGPKPMTVAVWAARRVLAHRLTTFSANPKVAHIGMAGAQSYTSPYSLGAGQTSIFLLDTRVDGEHRGEL